MRNQNLTHSTLYWRWFNCLHEVQLQQLPGVRQIQRQFLEELQEFRSIRNNNCSQILIVFEANIQPFIKFWIVHVQHDGEYAACCFVGLFNHFNVVFPSIESERSIKTGALHIMEIHCREHWQQEETAPKLSAPIIREDECRSKCRSQLCTGSEAGEGWKKEFWWDNPWQI